MFQPTTYVFGLCLYGTTYQQSNVQIPLLIFHEHKRNLKFLYRETDTNILEISVRIEHTLKLRKVKMSIEMLFNHNVL